MDDPTTPLFTQKTPWFSVSTKTFANFTQSTLTDLGGTLAVCRALKVDPEVGLLPNESFEPLYGISHATVEPFHERKQVFGRNEIPEAPEKGILTLLCHAYNDQTLYMLTVASVVSLAVGVWNDYSAKHPEDEPKVGWVDGVAILVAVVVVVITNATNDYGKEKQFRKLNAKKEDRSVKVFRGGLADQIRDQDIVVGDILLLEPGDMITVDCLYIEGHNFACDESTVTGETGMVKKNTDILGDCIILSGSKVVQGVAKAVVVAVGVHSLYGRAMMSMRGSQVDQTPLQRKLNGLADQIAKFGFGAACFMFGILLVKLLASYLFQRRWVSFSECFSEVIGMVIQAITVIVVAVPEGLPMAVTLALAFATTEMLKDNNLVRHLSACETMGNVTTVCSDKTGTLTENKMTVVQAIVSGCVLSTSHGLQRWRYQIPADQLELMTEAVALNTTAFETRDKQRNIKFVGSTTESALIEWIRKLGCSYQQLRSASHIVSVYPFNSEIKCMTTVIKMRECNAYNPGKSVYRLYTKGAPEVILPLCTHIIGKSGVQTLSQEARQYYENQLECYAKESLRTIVLAYRDMDVLECNVSSQGPAPLFNLVLIGIFGIQDTLRAGVTESVHAFQRAGVFVRMITGDNLETAKAFAKKCGILTTGGIAMTAQEFRAQSVEKQHEVMPRLQVLARSSPMDKTLIVSILQDMDEIVAMTGDGTNDGPALKMANVGFAMGVSGTDVANEASDIILMDDNFNSILQALKWGRAVNDGVRKFLTFQLTVNVAAVAVAFVSAIVSDTSESILSAVQLLWVNMIMDTFAALALATEPLTEELALRKPIRKDSSLINWRMGRMIAGQAIFQIVVNLLLMFFGDRVFGLSDAKVLRTLIFNVFVFMQVFNELNCRRINSNLNIFHGMMKDHLFLGIQAFVILSQIVIIQYGGLAFKTVPLTPSQWFYTIAIGSLSLPVGIFIRLLPNHLPLIWSENTKDEFTHAVSYQRLRLEATHEHDLCQVRLNHNTQSIVDPIHKV